MCWAASPGAKQDLHDARDCCGTRGTETFSTLLKHFSPGKYPPLHPISGLEGIFRRGGGCIFRSPAAGILYPPPLFYTPPTARRTFSGLVGGGCIKSGPVFWAFGLFFGTCAKPAGLQL